MDLTGIHNVGEFYSNHYLDAVLEGDLKSQLSSWRVREQEGGPRRPAKQLGGLAERYFKARAAADEEGDDEAGLTRRWEVARDFHAHLTEALGYRYQPGVEPLEDGLVVPVMCAESRDGQPYLWIVDAPFAPGEDVDVLDMPLLRGQLPVGMQDDETVALAAGSWRALLDGALFRQEHPPRWVIFLGGEQVALIDRHKWGQGRSLRFELGELYGRRTPRAFSVMGALLHRDVINPDEDVCLLDTLDESSHKHAYAVSTDLKHGARRAVELVANEAIYYRRTVQRKGVFNVDELAPELTRECLTYLYRLLFLFYVEARSGELGVVPMNANAYRMGYSLESLRELELVPLTTERARNGYYLSDSLEKLFEIVNQGFGVTGQMELPESDFESFQVHGLRSRLFDPTQTPIVSGVKLRNVVVQEVLALLSLSKEQRNRERGRISYAQLGINQLGAVYEGLLSYTGFFAKEDLFEVCAAGDMGDPEARRYFVPASALGDYEDSEIVKGEDGQPLRHPKGSYIFQLAGRDREKSASYYTPEVLTQCLTKYTLAERLGEGIAVMLGEEEAQPISADEMLGLTICEPAMGSGAFLNECLNQLADKYLERKQEELGEVLSSERYLEEKQRVKYYLAVHNLYGVDLNPMAAELGKVSVWLNILHERARAPYLDQQIVVGNSLVGCRFEVYGAGLLTEKSKKNSWLSCAPVAVQLPGVSEGVAAAQGSADVEERRLPREEHQIYHFLVPASGMLRDFYKDKVVKGLEPKKTDRIKKWTKDFQKRFEAMDVATCKRLSARVDELYAEHVRERTELLELLRVPVKVWGQPDVEASGPLRGRWLRMQECEEYAKKMERGTAPGRRLRAVMDYWCALWFWPVLEAELLPTRDEFLMEVEALLGGDVDGLAEESARIALVRELAERYRFHHWELAFPEVFVERGGFDVVIGNPPWLKLQWKEQGVLSDLEPKLDIKRMSAKQTADARAVVLQEKEARSTYLNEFEELSGAKNFLDDSTNYHELGGVQTNLYKCFLIRGLSVRSVRCSLGMFHQSGVFDDPKGGSLRSILYSNLRLAVLAKNQLKLFAEVEHQRHYCFTVYGPTQSRANARFISNLFHPRTLTDSITHDGRGPVPGIKNDEGNWDLRGHRSRIVRVDHEALELFATLFDDEGTPTEEARLPIVHSLEVLSVLAKFAKAPRHLSDLREQFFATEHFHQTNAQHDGTIREESRFPESVNEWILQGPHFYVGIPFNKTPNEGCRHNQDYSVIDLTTLPEDYLPRTNYVPACSPEEYVKRTPHWKGRPVTERFRHTHRRRVAPTGERTLVPTIMPPGPAHVNTVSSLSFDESRHMVVLSGLANSLPYDFFIKSTGQGDVYAETLAQFPVDPNGVCSSPILRRTLLLNCLTTHYAPLWEELYDPTFNEDSFTKPDPRLKPWSHLTPEWTWHTPLRTYYARRQALVELDALAALALGLTAEELCTIYRIQFPVLRQYEQDTWYDQRGHIIFTNNRGLTGVGLDRKTWNDVRHAKTPEALPQEIREQGFIPPFDMCDREDDMTLAYRVFAERLGMPPGPHLASSARPSPPIARKLAGGQVSQDENARPKTPLRSETVDEMREQPAEVGSTPVPPLATLAPPVAARQGVNRPAGAIATGPETVSDLEKQPDPIARASTERETGPDDGPIKPASSNTEFLGPDGASLHVPPTSEASDRGAAPQALGGWRERLEASGLELDSSPHPAITTTSTSPNPSSSWWSDLAIVQNPDTLQAHIADMARQQMGPPISDGSIVNAWIDIVDAMMWRDALIDDESIRRAPELDQWTVLCRADVPLTHARTIEELLYLLQWVYEDAVDAEDWPPDVWEAARQIREREIPIPHFGSPPEPTPDHTLSWDDTHLIVLRDDGVLDLEPRMAPHQHPTETADHEVAALQAEIAEKERELDALKTRLAALLAGEDPDKETDEEREIATRLSASIDTLAPSSLIVSVLQRANITTVGEFLEKTPDDFRSMRAVGRKKVKVLTQLLEQARQWVHGASAPEDKALSPTEEVLEGLRTHGVDLTLPWKDTLKTLPTRAPDRLLEAGAHTWEELVRACFDNNHLLSIRGLGRKTLKEMRAILRTVANEGLDVYLFGDDGVPETIPDLIQRMLGVLDPHDRSMIVMRLYHKKTLQELGDEHGVTRERIRQKLRDARNHLAAIFGPVAHELTRPLATAARACGGFLPMNALRNDFEVGELPGVVLALEVAGDSTFRALHDAYLTTLDDDAIEARFAGFREAITATRKTWLSWERMERLAERYAGLYLERADLARLLHLVLKYEVDEAGVRVSRSKTDLLAEILFEAGAPMGTDEVIEAYVARQDEPEESEFTQLSHAVRSNIARHSDIWTIGRGVYCHVEHLPFEKEAIAEYVRAAVVRLHGETGPVSTEWLMGEVGADAVEGLEPIAFRYALSQHPDIQTFHSSNLVAHTATYQEHGITLADRIESVLLESGEAMSLQEVQASMPEELVFHEVSLFSALTRLENALKLGRNVYVHRSNTGLTPLATKRLINIALSELPADGEAMASERLYQRVLNVSANAAIPVEGVEPHRVLFALLRERDDVVCGRSGLIARGDSEGSERLLEQAVLEIIEERETVSPAEIRSALEGDLGYRGPAPTVYAVLSRLVEQNTVVRLEEGVYRTSDQHDRVDE